MVAIVSCLILTAMKIIILAAGAGRRLRPLTDNLPKCLVKVGGKAIIDYQMENLRQVGLNEIIVVIGFCGEQIINHLTKGYPDFNFTFIENPDYASTHPAHSLWMVRDHLASNVMYLNADVICDPKIIKRIVDDPRPTVTAVQQTPWDEEEVNVVVDQEMRVLEMGKHISKELSYGEFIGVTKIAAAFNKTLTQVLQDFFDHNEFRKFAADALNLSIQRGETMYALDVSDVAAIEIDTPEDLEDAHHKLALITW